MPDAAAPRTPAPAPAPASASASAARAPFVAPPVLQRAERGGRKRVSSSSASSASSSSSSSSASASASSTTRKRAKKADKDTDTKEKEKEVIDLTAEIVDEFESAADRAVAGVLRELVRSRLHGETRYLRRIPRAYVAALVSRKLPALKITGELVDRSLDALCPPPPPPAPESQWECFVCLESFDAAREKSFSLCSGGCQGKQLVCLECAFRTIDTDLRCPTCRDADCSVLGESAVLLRPLAVAFSRREAPARVPPAVTIEREGGDEEDLDFNDELLEMLGGVEDLHGHFIAEDEPAPAPAPPPFRRFMTAREFLMTEEPPQRRRRGHRPIPVPVPDRVPDRAPDRVPDRSRVLAPPADEWTPRRRRAHLV